MADCPRCEATLSKPHTCGSCGWKARVRKDLEAQTRDYVHCAFEGCAVCAIARVHTALGWANLCEQHYVAHYTREAAKSSAKRGLDRKPDETPEQHRKRLMAWMRQNARLKTFEDAAQAEEAWATA